jgi:glycosyltransferase involved in cell wall biosynthesis
MQNPLSPTVFCDVGPLLSWSGSPTGIQRTIASLLWEWIIAPPFALRFCRFHETRAQFLPVPEAEVLEWYTGAGWRGDEISAPKISAVQANGEFEFGRNDVFFTCAVGTATPTYCATLYAQKQRIGFKTAFVFYDLIPCHMPQTFWDGYAPLFTKWAVDALWCADVVLAISQNTANDIKSFTAENLIPCPKLKTIRLGENVSTQASAPPRIGHTLLDERFVLSVGTAEVRKNHIALYYCWRELFKKHRETTPMLIIVGRPGWLSADVRHQMTLDPLTSQKICFLPEATDAELNWLYENCMFTMYPSLYEGWGLPVAESLAKGKYCIASNASSIPEIGGNLIDYHDPQNWQQAFALATRAIDDPDFLAAKQAQIQQEYTPTQWQKTAQQTKQIIIENLLSLDQMDCGK